MSIKKIKSAKAALEKMGAGPVTFGSLLKTHRLAEEMTQAEMSRILKISLSHLSDIENERKFVSIERAKEFAKRLKDSEKYFVLVALRDLLRRADCHYEIELKAI
jgi:transcriptional regulator with XRE-family HTH domain